MYTEQEVETLTKTYGSCEDKQHALDECQKLLGKSRRSIIGKLSRLGVYEKKVYLTKRGSPPITKQELVHNLSRKWDIDLPLLAGLEKAPKNVLQLILDA